MTHLRGSSLGKDRLTGFVKTLELCLHQPVPEQVMLDEVRAAMQELVAHDDWLPERFARPDSMYYRQYLLHADRCNRFSVVSFVWGPGQRTPIHDHCTWGVVGILRGAEVTTVFEQGAEGVRAGVELTLRPGDVTVVSPRVGDIHRVRNAYDDRVSISIHAYGANIGKQVRHIFDPNTGASKTFISGYSELGA